MNAPLSLPPDPDEPEIGDFEQGTPGSRWALGRYLVGRAIGEYVSRGVLAFALFVVAIAALVYWIGPTWLAVLIGVFALCVLLMRWLLGALLRRLTAVDIFGPHEARMRAGPGRCRYWPHGSSVASAAPRRWSGCAASTPIASCPRPGSTNCT